LYCDYAIVWRSIDHSSNSEETELSNRIRAATSSRISYSAIRFAARWLVALLAFFCHAQFAAGAVVTGVGNADKLVPRIEYLEDAEGRLAFADVLQPTYSERFKALPEGTHPNFGLSKSAYWLRMSLSLKDGETSVRFLEVAYPFLGGVEFFSEGAHIATGATLPFASRPVSHRNFVFPLNLRAGTTAIYYLRVTSEGTLTIPVHLWQPAAFHRAAQDSYFLLGLYYGEFIALLLYNLILFVTLRDRAYLAYIGFVAVIAITNLSYNGLGMQYVWFDWPAEGRIGLTFTLALSAIFSMQFSRIFLNTKLNAPRMDVALQTASGIFIVALLVAIFDLRKAFFIMAANGLIFPALCLAAGLVSWRKGHATARFFLLGWSALLIGTTIYTMRTLNLVPANFFTLNTIQMGTAAELLLFSFALADRTRQLIRKNAELQERERQLHEAAHHDPLTGLGNRLLLEDRLNHALQLAHRNCVPMAVILVDLDNFKPVNDQYGHAAGDALLKAVALVLVNSVRTSDTVTRLGGDEFVLVLESLNLADDAYRIAEKIRREVCRGMTVAGQTLQVSASFGVAVFPEDGKKAEDLLRWADEAMYRDKEVRRGMKDLISA
jgi:two-component system, sensor histidine kinase LadS